MSKAYSSLAQVIGDLRVLNPGVRLDFDSKNEMAKAWHLVSGKGAFRENTLFSQLPAKNLVLPEGARSHDNTLILGQATSPDLLTEVVVENIKYLDMARQQGVSVGANPIKPEIGG